MTKLNRLAEAEIERLVKHAFATLTMTPPELVREAMRFAYRHAAAICITKGSGAMAAMLTTELLQLLDDMDDGSTLSAQSPPPTLRK